MSILLLQGLSGALFGAAMSLIVLYFITFHTNVNFYLYAVIGIMTSVVCGYAASFLSPQPRGLEGLTLLTSR